MIDRTETMPAIKVAENILILMSEISVDEIEEAISKLNTADTTWGLLWGNPVSKLSRLDNDFYNLKRQLLESILKVRTSKNFALIFLVRDKIMKNIPKGAS